MKQLIQIIIILIVTFSFAQVKDKALQKSNDYVYEGNALVNEDFVAAEKKYRIAISKKPSNPLGAYNLGNAYFESSLYSEALLRHIEAVNLATTKIKKHKAYHNIGNALMKQKKCKPAVEAFKNALRNDPTDEETRYNLVLAKECAEQQGEGGGNDDKENEDKEKGEDEKDENNDDGDDKEDNKEGDDKDDEDGKPKDEKGNKNDGDPKNEKKQQQPQQGKLSPQQVKNLLEAMNNQEKQVREKINAKKVKGEKIKTEKDW